MTSGIVEAGLTAGLRTAVHGHLSVKEPREECKVLFRHRDSVNPRIGAMLRAAASKNTEIEALQCRRTYRLLFPKRRRRKPRWPVDRPETRNPAST